MQFLPLAVIPVVALAISSIRLLLVPLLKLDQTNPPKLLVNDLLQEYDFIVGEKGQGRRRGALR